VPPFSGEVRRHRHAKGQVASWRPGLPRPRYVMLA